MESTGLGTFVRESPSLLAYPLILTLHSIGLAFLVGINLAIDLRILGVASQLPLAPMERFLPVFWAGFWVNALSGVALLFGGATTLLQNPVFYIKLVAIMFAMIAIRLIRRMVFSKPAAAVGLPMAAKMLAGASLFFWGAAITAGRLTAYLGVPIDPLLGY
jgi:hypothetical protein